MRAAACLLIAAGMLAGCGRKSATAPTAASVTSLVSQVSIGTSVGELVSASFPIGAPLAPSVTASDSFVAGSGALLIVTVPDSAVALLVGATGHPDHFRIAITAAAREALTARSRKLAEAAPARVGSRGARLAGELELALVVRAQSEQRVLPLVLGAEYAHSASQPAAHTLSASSRAAASNQLQISLSWAAKADLDLHVEPPVAGGDSTDIYYGNHTDSGGSLDLDSNAACSIDDIDNENVTWGANIPPAGTYKVRVDLWSSCGVADTIKYVLTIRQCGQDRTVNGFALRSQADGGTAFSGKLVASFDFTPCPSPQTSLAAAPWRRLLPPAAPGRRAQRNPRPGPQ